MILTWQHCFDQFSLFFERGCIMPILCVWRHWLDFEDSSCTLRLGIGRKRLDRNILQFASFKRLPSAKMKPKNCLSCVDDPIRYNITGQPTTCDDSAVTHWTNLRHIPIQFWERLLKACTVVAYIQNIKRVSENRGYP